MFTCSIDLCLQVMDMEHELQALRIQLEEKSKHSLLLQKEVLKHFIAFLTAVYLEIKMGW